MMKSTESQWLAAFPRGFRLAALLALLASWAWSSPGRTAEVVDLRIGDHPEFTRVVFELDLPAPHKIARSGPDSGVSEIVVVIEAASIVRDMKSPGGRIDSVKLAPSGKRSTARIRLESGDLKLKEMILSDPPRIVLDVLAASPPAKSERSARTDMGGKPDSAKFRKVPAPPAIPNAGIRKAPKPPGSPAGSPLPAAAPSILAASDFEEPSEGAMARSEALAEGAGLPAVAAPLRSEPDASGAGGSSAFGDRSLAIAGLLVAVAAVAVVGLRRRNSGADSAVAWAGPGDFEADEESSADNPFAGIEEGSGDQLVFRAEDEDPSLSNGTAQGASDPVHGAGTESDSPNPDADGTPSGGVDVWEKVHGLEGQLADLEDRLQDVVHARDRLERQMTAQNEELRVQRSAIARTQRAVRNLNRVEDDAEEDEEEAERSDES